MAFMDGAEPFHRLREIRADIPVVLCTGFIRGDRLDRLMKAGIAGFLRKPLAPNEIVDHIRGVLESVKYARHGGALRSEEHTSELQSLTNLVCRLLLEKKNKSAKTL